MADRHSHTESRIAHGSVDDQYKEIYIDIDPLQFRRVLRDNDEPRDLTAIVTISRAAFRSGRSNMRIQIFDKSSHYAGQWKDGDIGRPYNIAMSRNGTEFVPVESDDQPKASPDRVGIAVRLAK